MRHLKSLLMSLCATTWQPRGATMTAREWVLQQVERAGPDGWLVRPAEEFSKDEVVRAVIELVRERVVRDKHPCHKKLVLVKAKCST